MVFEISGTYRVTDLNFALTPEAPFSQQSAKNEKKACMHGVEARLHYNVTISKYIGFC